MKKIKLIKTLLLINLILFGINNMVYAQSCTKVIDVNFNNYGNGTKYDISKATNDFNGVNTRGAGEVRGLDGNGKTWPQKNVIVDGALRAEYLANSFGGPKGGFLFDKTFPDTDEAFMEYRVKFGPDFYWAAGGKLPGLGGSALSNVASIPDGCTNNINKIQNGFSARIMWRPLAQTQNGWGAPKARLVVYTYMPNRDLSSPQQRCGVDLNATGEISSNTWYTIKQHIKLNTPGVANGLIELFVDGNLVYRSTNNIFRNANKGNVKINSAMFQTYRGGADSRFTSSKTENIYFDNFKVWINCSNNTSNTNPSNALTNGAVYKIISKNSNKAVDVLNVSTANGANVQQYGYGGGNNQKWRAESLPDGFWKFISINSGKCLEVSGYSNDIGANIQQWDYIGHNYQQWKVESLGDGSFKVTNRGSGKVLDVSGISQNDGANIHQWNFLNGANQKWIFTRVDGFSNREIQNEIKNPISSNLVYPNPTSGIAYLEVQENTITKIIDLTGKTVLETKSLAKETISLDLNRLNTGMYIIETTTNEVSTYQKIVLQ